MVLDRSGWLRVKRSTNSTRLMSPRRSSIPEASQRRWPSPSDNPMGPCFHCLSSAGAPRAAPPRMRVPAPVAAAWEMSSSCSRWTAE
jgi:hypothetical protein